MLRLTRVTSARWNRHKKPTSHDDVQPSHDGLWDRANKHMKPRDKEAHEWGMGGRIRGHMFSGADGKTTLSGKFSYHKIPKKIENMSSEQQTEMWLSRPYLDRQETHFMETGEFIPREGFNDKDYGPNAKTEDDQGNYVVRPQIKYPKELTPKYVIDKKKLKLEAERLKYSLSLPPNEYAADMWASAFKYKVGDGDCSKEKLNKINLDFYDKYHEMAVPTRYPLSMPPPKDDWKNWVKIPEFKKYAGKVDTNEPTKFDPSLRCRGGPLGPQAQQGEISNPLTQSDTEFDDKEMRHRYGLKGGEYYSNIFDSREFETYGDNGEIGLGPPGFRDNTFKLAKAEYLNRRSHITDINPDIK